MSAQDFWSRRKAAVQAETVAEQKAVVEAELASELAEREEKKSADGEDS